MGYARTSIFTSQALGAGFAGGGDQLLQVFGIVDVDCDSDEVQNDARFPRSLRGGLVRLEAVVAEAEGEQICGAAEGGGATGANTGSGGAGCGIALATEPALLCLDEPTAGIDPTNHASA